MTTMRVALFDIFWIVFSITFQVQVLEKSATGERRFSSQLRTAKNVGSEKNVVHSFSLKPRFA